MRQFKKQQSGFTLVEIAIVLVIVGILLGGVLQGQQMIENSRMKGVVNDMNGISAASNSYFDRYRALPGDEPIARMTARGWIVTQGGNADGVMAWPLNTTFNGGGAERVGFFQSLRASGFLTGPANAVGVAALPVTSTGGVMSVAAGAYGMGGNQVCVANLTTRQVAGVDGIIDGANAANNTGAAMSATGANNLVPTNVAPAATAYNEATVATNWTLCRTL